MPHVRGAGRGGISLTRIDPEAAPSPRDRRGIPFRSLSSSASLLGLSIEADAAGIRLPRQIAAIGFSSSSCLWLTSQILPAKSKRVCFCSCFFVSLTYALDTPPQQNRKQVCFWFRLIRISAELFAGSRRILRRTRFSPACVHSDRSVADGGGVPAARSVCRDRQARAERSCSFRCGSCRRQGGDGRVGRARAVPSSAERPLAADASRSACPGSIGCRGRSGRCGTYGIRRRFLRRSSRGRARLWRRGPYDRSCRCLSPVCRQPFRMASSSRRALGCIPRRFSSSSSVRIIRFNSPRKSAVSPARRFLTNGT